MRIELEMRIFEVGVWSEGEERGEGGARRGHIAKERRGKACSC
jgi:hypothetical protein